MLGNVKLYIGGCERIAFHGCILHYRLGTVNSKSFVGKVLLRIKWNLN